MQGKPGDQCLFDLLIGKSQPFVPSLRPNTPALLFIINDKGLHNLLCLDPVDMWDVTGESWNAGRVQGEQAIPLAVQARWDHLGLGKCRQHWGGV